MRAPAFLAIAALAAVPLAARQQAPTQFKSATEVVSVYTTVHDRSGRLVPDLRKEDFVVLDNGKEQPLTHFSNEATPFTAVVMLDQSGSMRPHRDAIVDAASAFVRQLTPVDKARIGRLGWRIQIEPPQFTSRQGGPAPGVAAGRRRRGRVAGLAVGRSKHHGALRPRRPPRDPADERRPGCPGGQPAPGEFQGRGGSAASRQRDGVRHRLLGVGVPRRPDAVRAPQREPAQDGRHQRRRLFRDDGHVGHDAACSCAWPKNCTISTGSASSRRSATAKSTRSRCASSARA